jgi:hypothetical protein
MYNKKLSFKIIVELFVNNSITTLSITTPLLTNHDTKQNIYNKQTDVLNVVISDRTARIRH